jgi:hypothetical protein
MRIRIVLHFFDGNLVLFEGSPAECPPVPRPGDEIVHDEHRVRLEGVRYQYWPEHLEIALLA